MERYLLSRISVNWRYVNPSKVSTMNRPLKLVVTLVALSLTSWISAGDLSDSGLAALPSPARKAVERHSTCLELIRQPREAGSASDRLIRQQMQKLRCDKSYLSFQKTKKKYGNRPDVMAILERVEDGWSI